MPAKAAAITEETIKQCSGQFDLETVFKLHMPKLGLRRIQNLHLCPSLTELDLSHNRIGRIEGLDALEELKKLVLVDNDIEGVENVSKLASLETLMLQGNRISNIDDVGPALSSLPCLRHLALQMRDDPDARNPVCDHPGYYVAMRRMLPKLQALDGERTVLADAAAVPSSSPLDGLDIKDPEPWLKDFNWQVATAQSEPLEGTREFEAALTDCKRLSARAQSLIDTYRTSGR